MNKIEEIKKKIEDSEEILQNLQQELLISQAIEKFSISNVQNNLLNDVKLIKCATISAANKYLLIFNLNRVEHRYEIDIGYADVLRNVVSEKLAEILFSEIRKNLGQVEFI